MTPIAAIKTKSDALALIEAISTPAAQPLPEPLADDATPAHKAAHANTVDLLQTANANAEQEAAFISSVKDFVKARIAALPESVNVIGLDVRASSSDRIEAVSIRIIQHQ